MRAVFLTFLFLILSLPAFAADGAVESAYDRVMRTGNIRCGYILYPPYMEKDVNTGQMKGSAYDFLTEAAKLLNLSISWTEEIAIGTEAAALQANRVDSVCAITGPYNPGFLSQITFSKPIFFVQNAIFARADDVRFSGKKTFEDLNSSDYAFAGIEGDSTQIYAKELFPKARRVDLPQMSDVAQMFLEIDGKKADLVIVEPAVAALAIARNPGKFRRVDVTGELPSYWSAPGFRKDEYRLRDAFSEITDYMHINGITDRILNAYDPDGKDYLRVTKPYKVPK